jgi:hypothetical protein
MRTRFATAQSATAVADDLVNSVASTTDTETVITVDLDELTATIRTALEGAEHAAHSLLEHALTAGDALIQAKKQVGRGWLKYLRERINRSEDTAERYMLLARHRQLFETDSARVRNLSLNAALRLIKQSAAPSAGSRALARKQSRKTVPNGATEAIAPSAAPASTAEFDDVGLASSGEIARLTARTDELQAEKRRLEFQVINLRSEIDDLKTPPKARTVSELIEVVLAFDVLAAGGDINAAAAALETGAPARLREVARLLLTLAACTTLKANTVEANADGLGANTTPAVLEMPDIPEFLRR